MSESSARASTHRPTLRALLDQMLEATMAKDKAAVLATFAPDAVFTDPHYPNPEMRGLDDIAAGLDWGFLGMERFGFTVVGSFMSEDGNSGAIEMDCEHVLASGRTLTFPQVFVAGMEEGLLVRVRAYEPYGPGGVAMAAIRVQNWLLRLRRKTAGGGRS
ncbi:nuclear transport factor 2 family protein [Tessaracoccus antarcticus]|nr:nuclear transport factor 2 family protein [Tessaracoccus antarcticus]